MSGALEIASRISTPLALIAFVSVLVLFAFALWLRQQEKKLRSLTPEERARAIDRYLTRYKIDGSKLTRDQAFQLIRDEMEKKHRLILYLSTLCAAVFVVCFVSAVFAPPPPPKKTARLSVSLQGSKLTAPSGINLVDKPGVFEGDSVDEVTDRAADWVAKTLEAKFPRTESSQTVRVRVKIDQRGDAHEVSVEPPGDHLRQDRFWVFAGEVKLGHLDMSAAQAATRDAINMARTTAAAVASKNTGGKFDPREIRVEKLLLHSERPGYRLGLFEVPVNGTEVTHQLERLREPAMTVIVEGIVGNALVGEKFRNALRRPTLVVGDPDLLAAKKQSYANSKERDLTREQRLTFLEDARIDAFVGGTYEEISK